MEEFGRVWMSASHFTKSFGPIKKAIENGAETIVLLKCLKDVRRPAQGRRTMRLNHLLALTSEPEDKIEIALKDQFGNSIEDTLYCTSTNGDIDTLTFDEVNNLYDQIRKFSPSTKVVVNYSPSSEEDFSQLSQVNADAIEIITRGYKPTDIQRPFIVRFIGDSFISDSNSSYWDSYVNKYMEEFSLTSEQARRKLFDDLKELHRRYSIFLEEKLDFFRRNLTSLQEQESRPILLKLTRDEFELGSIMDYLKLPAQGIVMGDSQKMSSDTTLGGRPITIMGKSSVCGEQLFASTYLFMEAFRNITPHAYLSASGGIITPQNAISCIKVGANSVQLCSAAQFGGFERIREIREAIDN